MSSDRILGQFWTDPICKTRSSPRGALADFYVEDPAAFQDLDASPEMPRLHLDAVDVKERRCHSAWTPRPQAAYGYCHDGIRCGARAAREPWSQPMAARSAGRLVSRLATRNCVSKGTKFETCGGRTVPCYQFQGGNAGTPTERDISWLPLRGRSRYRLPSQRPP